MPDAQYEHPEPIEAEVIVRIDELDNRHIGLFTIERMGEMGDGLTPLVMADAPITSELISVIKRNARRLGPENTPLTHIRLKRNKKARVVEPVAPLEKKNRIAVFEGIRTTYESVKDHLAMTVPDPESLFLQNEREATKKIREIAITIEPEFRDMLASSITRILENKDKATLFACLDQYGEEMSEHGLRVFMMGTKLLAKANRYRSSEIYSNRHMLDYGIGLLFHDVGMIFLPKSLREKQLRVPLDQLQRIEAQCRLRGVDQKYITIIRAVNDPRQVFTRKIENYLSEEIKKFRFLVNDGILTLDQYSALRRFPNYSCLSASEQKMMEKHPVWGWEMVRKAARGSPLALDLVKNHHQRLDNSGYPDVLTDMTIAAQITAAVDLFDGMVTERCYSEALPYVDGFKMLNALTSSEDNKLPKLDRDVYDLFCAYVQRYPVGSFLRIEAGSHDGGIGMVTEFDVYSPNKPEFVLFRDRQGKRMTKGLLFKKKDYDGSFRIVSLPFTEKVRREMLAMEPLGGTA